MERMFPCSQRIVSVLDRFRGNSKFINRIRMKQNHSSRQFEYRYGSAYSHLPVPGETILGGKFLMNQGGKGANQAVAVKRLGGDLLFVAKLGDDILGQQAFACFSK